MKAPVKFQAVLDVNTKKRNALELIVQLTNESTSTQRVLKWGSPFDQVGPASLRVFVDEIEIPYDGRVAKRGAPTKNSFITLRPKSTTSVVVNLGRYFQLNTGGDLRVTFDSPLFLATNGNSLALNSCKQVFAGFEATRKHVPQATMTEGEKVRKKKDNVESAPFFSKKLRLWLLGPVITGGSREQRATARLAYNYAVHSIFEAQRQLKIRDMVRERWFGNGSVAQIGRVYASLTSQIMTGFPPCPRPGQLAIPRGYSYKLIIGGSECDSDTYAYTYPCTSSMWICSQFWSAPMVGSTYEYGTRAGTIVHEMTHSWSNTDDFVYGRTRCKQLASSNSGRAVRNADSLEYFCEDIGLGLLPGSPFNKPAVQAVTL